MNEQSVNRRISPLGKMQSLSDILKKCIVCILISSFLFISGYEKSSEISNNALNQLLRSSPDNVLITSSIDNIYPEFDHNIKRYSVKCKSRDEGDILQININNNTYYKPIDMRLQIGEYSFYCVPKNFPNIEHRRYGMPTLDYMILNIIYSDTTPQHTGKDFYYTVVMDNNSVPVYVTEQFQTSYPVQAHINSDYPFSYLEFDRSDIIFYNKSLENITYVKPIQAGYIDHHDWHYAGDNEFCLLSNTIAKKDLSRFVDKNSDPFGIERVIESNIQCVDNNGNILFEWNVAEHIPLEDCYTIVHINNRIDPYHINSIEVIDDYIIISFRHCSTIMKIDKTTGKPVWRIGKTKLDDDFYKNSNYIKPLDIVNDPKNEFCGQHSPRTTQNGTIVLIDNGNKDICIDNTKQDEYTRIVEYEIDEVNKQAKFVHDYSLNNAKNTYYHAGGNIELLESGNWLISWGDKDYKSKHSLDYTDHYSYTEYNPYTKSEIWSTKLMYKETLLPIVPYPITKEFLEILKSKTDNYTESPSNIVLDVLFRSCAAMGKACAAIHKACVAVRETCDVFK